MARLRGVVGVLAVSVLTACGGGGGTTAADAPAATPTSAAPAGACGLKPVTFANERWEGTGEAPRDGTGVLWQQTFTFTNPNTVDVRVAAGTVHLRLSGSGGYFFKFARTSFRPVADEVVPAGKDRARVTDLWLAVGNTPATEDFFVSASAKVGGADCPVPIERVSANPAPAHILALPSCDPREAAAAC